MGSVIVQGLRKAAQAGGQPGSTKFNIGVAARQPKIQDNLSVLTLKYEQPTKRNSVINNILRLLNSVTCWRLLHFTIYELLNSSSLSARFSVLFFQ